MLNAVVAQVVAWPDGQPTPGSPDQRLRSERQVVDQGQPLLDFSRDGLPEWDYAVTVTRCTQPERYEIYTSTLPKRLPRFKVPLAPDDRDTVLDLQATFTRAFDHGNFSARIDYTRDPATRISDAHKSWAADWLKQMRLR